MIPAINTNKNFEPYSIKLLARCMAKSVKVDYEAVLESLVSWGLEDDSDTAAEAIVGNAFQAQQ